LRRFGFNVIDLRTAYDDQYILLEAATANPSREIEHHLSENIDTLIDWVAGFESVYPSVLRYWEMQLERLKQQLKRVVIWGGGSKGVAFLNAIEVSAVIEYVVDIHPFRQQTFMAGTGQPIVAPAFLKEYQPDIVIVMNAIYGAEIRQELNQLGLNPSLVTLDHRKALGD
jgi:FlaA1/EpsC-like NDP-sugar epimerase